MHIERTVLTDWDPETTFAYVADFTTTTQWDPGTVSTTRISGDGGIGTTYRNVSRFRGRQTELTYQVVEYEAPHRIHLRGENATVIGNDIITVDPRTGGSRVTYSADFTFKGLAKFIAPLLSDAFKELGDAAADGLRRALSGAGPEHSPEHGPSR